METAGSEIVSMSLPFISLEKDHKTQNQQGDILKAGLVYFLRVINVVTMNSFW